MVTMTMQASGAWSVVVAVVLGLLLLAKLLPSSKYRNLPPGPRGLPIIGSLHLLGKFPQRDFTKLAETYGPLMSIWLGPRLVVVATSPAAAEEILKTQDSNFANRMATSFGDVIQPGVASEKMDDEQELEQVSNFGKILRDMAKYIQTLNPGDFIPLFKRMDVFGFERQLQDLKKRMDAFMSSIIFEHIVQRKSGSIFVKDMVDVLLDQMEDETLQFDITDANVNSTLWNAFAGSINTTTDTIEWAIAECIRNPIVMKKVQEELDIVVGKSRRVEDADVPNLKYLQAVIKENFRLHPIGPMLVPHLSEKPCKVLGYDIPEKTLVIINVAAIAQDPKTWEDPMIFKPERFLDGMLHANVRIGGKIFEVLPFGAGRRQCPGIILASTLIHIMVATFMQSFEWSLPNGLQPIDLDMSETEGFGHVLAHPMIAILKARLSMP